MAKKSPEFASDVIPFIARQHGVIRFLFDMALFTLFLPLVFVPVRLVWWCFEHVDKVRVWISASVFHGFLAALVFITFVAFARYFRRTQRQLYGLGEVAMSVVAFMLSATHASDSFAATYGVGAAVWLAVRGTDNIAEGWKNDKERDEADAKNAGKVEQPPVQSG